MSTTRSVAAHRLGVAFAIPCALWATGAPVAEAQEVFYDDAEVVLVAPASATDKALWGQANLVTYSVSAFGFESGGVYLPRGWGETGRWMQGDGVFKAPLQLPTGARIVAIELAGCDVASSAEISFYLVAGLDTVDYEILSPVFRTGVGEMPGCGAFNKILPTPRTVDNLFRSYLATIVLGADDSTTRVGGFRVYYKLQVSPPPGSATFSDVPTGHPFFRHVEALAASGITSGCGGSRFCPGAPLTRGQMAVFLAKALGLHWPN